MKEAAREVRKMLKNKKLRCQELINRTEAIEKKYKVKLKVVDIICAQ